MMKKNFLVLFFSVAMLLGITTIASANLVTNGGFETGSFSGWTQSGNTGFTDIRTGLDYVHSGDYAAAFGPVGSLGYISQEIATTPGSEYQLSFWLKNGYSETPNEFQVKLGNSTVISNASLSAFDYTEYKYNFIASASATPLTLEFGFRHDPSYFYIDDISVTATPVPAAIWILGSGLAGLAGMIRRRKKMA